MKLIFFKENFFICKYEIIFRYPFESCTRGLDCERRRVVLGPHFFSTSGHSSPKFLTSVKWRLFGRSGIMGLKIQNNFWIPIWDIQVGSRALVMLRHSLVHFDQTHIVFGLILVNPKRRWVLKRQILHLKIWSHIWIAIWELYTWPRLREKMCSSWVPFSQLRVILAPSLTSFERRLFGRSGIMGLKI